MMSMPVSVRCILLLASWPAVLAEVIKGISYGPVPLKSVEGGSQVPADDWFCDEAVAMWGSSGRGDLAVMRSLGANMVRLYGNNAENDHSNFLDEAYVQGLGVAPGMSDFPYFQGAGSCTTTDYDCFTQVMPLYLQNLQNGFLNLTGSYHPALKYMNIINEPDLKMPYDADIAGKDEVYRMCRAVISAFDGVLEAEKVAGVTGPLINFTVTFSYAVCQSCEFSHGIPGLSQMAQLKDAMYHPAKYNYTPRNNITAAFEARFTNSFNTANPARDVKLQLLDFYQAVFPRTPVYIGEYHHVGGDQAQDLHQILQYAESSSVFLGISFFQYQVAYWKTGSEMDFGMFGLGDLVVATMPYVDTSYDIYCLTPNEGMPEAVAQVYGGVGVDAASLCEANPSGVSPNQEGYDQIAKQHSAAQMERFVEHVLHHMGAAVKRGHRSDLHNLAKQYSRGNKSGFVEMAGYFGSHPAWVYFDPDARCLADRSAEPSHVGAAIGWVCSQGVVSCDDVPVECNSTYRLGDYLFSRFVAASGGAASNPLVSCSFGGAGIFAPKEVYKHWNGEDGCALNAAARSSWTTTPIATLPATTAITTVTTTVASTSAATATTATTRSTISPQGDVTTRGASEATTSAPAARVTTSRARSRPTPPATPQAARPVDRPQQLEVIKGFSYGPRPVKSTGQRIPGDDWFCDEAVPMWGASGRGDLAVMRRLGANMVRLYGNNADLHHGNFLDEAWAQGLRVAPGLSDFPFTQGAGSCHTTDYNCFSQVRPLYLKNLQNGFLDLDGSYRPALQYMNIINEPDLKLPWNADIAGVGEVHQMCRAIISAFDGMLEAEKQAGVTGKLINFTVTFSYAMCLPCERSPGVPGLAQMAQLDDAMRNPEKYNYTPQNDITAAYKARFTNSFNTVNAARDVQLQFLHFYDDVFPNTPVYIGEYHHRGGASFDQSEDLHAIMHLAETSPLFLGIAFFQYQKAYWKGGPEMAFGMFGLGDDVLGTMPYMSETYNVSCLQPVKDMPGVVSKAYEGAGIDEAELCELSPMAVELSQAGFSRLASQGADSRLVMFAERMLHHVGATVRPEHRQKLELLVRTTTMGFSRGEEFASLAKYFREKRGKVDWLEADAQAKCLADRRVSPSTVGDAIGWVCSQNGVDCEKEVPLECNSSTYRLGDYLFSRYFEAQANKSDPLVSCSFGGAGIFAPSEVYSKWTGAGLCAVGGAPSIATTTPPTTSMTASRPDVAVPTTSSDADAGHHTATAGDEASTTAETSVTATVASTPLSSDGMTDGEEPSDADDSDRRASMARTTKFMDAKPTVSTTSGSPPNFAPTRSAFHIVAVAVLFVWVTSGEEAAAW